MDTKLPLFTVRVVSFVAPIIMLSLERVPLSSTKALIVFQKDLLGGEPSLPFS